ncbi:peptidylprolyl isomerase [Subsaximicrobium wynnwilliamsii]|uniref:Peptidylprolyl isomerase n=1 Tax=Subsaximicrobium wynnwilliamsii TaxID=291179 RepID=A0A5C6ZLP8_9FLAO|nr:peptidylprolyl isomerase [Subsaximicrobium wynnwilliamsii]TXD84239.1 peptidylprolyl isomerase [Subsaximicrobium wynnwilliamsii]TXD89860.1 peptidylprolyl isomerase [Subsaximicrobium wynnwilliamsii]TXE03951.1 peptidylprolyl isomerase [Subsaximicrobium wynnwilliamsii]
MKLLITAICLSFSVLIYAQEDKKDVLFTVDGEPVMTSEFQRVYNKNLDLVKDESQKDIDAYLELFVNYKLKVKDAKRLGLDKDAQYVKEFNNYKNQLSKNYMTDNKVTDKLVKEAYDRISNEVKASHILIMLDENETDTTQVYNRLLELRQRVLDEGFAPVQKEVHDRETVFAEDLGWFSGFKMVYPFETEAYNTKLGEVSMPFRSKFGFHIVKVWDKRKSLGEVAVAHIMIAKQQQDSTIDPETRIQQIYGKIEQGEKFESLAKQFSDDNSSSSKGGELAPFSGGQLSSKAFEDVAFSLENKNDISKPFQSEYGWHIIKLIDKKEMQSFEDMQSELESRVKRDSRSQLINSAMVKKLKEKYQIKDHPEALTYFAGTINEDFFKRTWNIPEQIESDKIILKIKDDSYTYRDFADYLMSAQRNYSNKPLKPEVVVNKEYEAFLERKLLQYQEAHLEEENEDFAHVLQEYRDGLLLFDLMEQEIWNKATKDSLGLQAFFDTHQSDYVWKDRADGSLLTSASEKEISKARKALKKGDSIEAVLTERNKNNASNILATNQVFEQGDQALPETYNFKNGISEIFEHNDAYHILITNEILPAGAKTLKEARGRVVSDYQNQLEKDWLTNLHERYTVEINKAALQQVKLKLQK